MAIFDIVNFLAESNILSFDASLETPYCLITPSYFSRRKIITIYHGHQEIFRSPCPAPPRPSCQDPQFSDFVSHLTISQQV